MCYKFFTLIKYFYKHELLNFNFDQPKLTQRPILLAGNSFRCVPIHF